MKYFNIHLSVDARNPKEAIRLLKQYLDECAEDLINDEHALDMGMGISLHCTEHDPTIPYMSGSGDWHEDKNEHDCTDGCQK